MRHWRDFAGLAKKYDKQPLQIIFANPFAFLESVYPKVEKVLAKVGLEKRPANFAFLRQASHPAVDRRGSAVMPGWNASNAEIAHNGLDGCYVLFDRSGDLVFVGRLTFEEVERRVRRLLE